MMIQLRKKVAQLVGGYRLTQVIGVSCKLGIFDLLKDKPRSLSFISKKTNTKPQLLLRILEVLTKAELIQSKSGLFKTTQAGLFLCSEHELSLKNFAILSHAPWYWQPWSNLEQTLHKGKSAFSITHGMPAFLFMNKNEQAAKDFHQAMASSVKPIPMVLKDSVNMDHVKSVLDLGGGDGSLAVEVANKYSQLKVTVGDLAHAKKYAKINIKKSKTSEQVRFEELDFFKKLKNNYDLIILRHIIHDWSDEQAIKIIKNCKKALNKNGKIIVIERVKSNQVNLLTALGSVEMMVAMEMGLERSLKEFKNIYKTVKLKNKMKYHESIDRYVFTLS